MEGKKIEVLMILCPFSSVPLLEELFLGQRRIGLILYVMFYAVFFLLNFKTERYLSVSFLGLLNVLVHLLCNMLPYLFEKRPFVGKTITLN